MDNSIFQWLRNNLDWAGYGLIALIFFFGVGYIIPFTIQVETSRTVLTAMIGAQASILAIVVSVTLISTQLVATRYAPRMATLPFRTSLFRGAFAVFGLSIVLDVVLLLIVNTREITSSVYRGLLIMAIFGFFGVLMFLYHFVRGMISKTSPETLVALFTETVSVDEYLQKCKCLAEDASENAHPLQQLYRFVMAALSQNEFTTAQTALDQYQSYVLDTINAVGAKEVYETLEQPQRRALFRPVLKDHIPSISIHAAEKDEYQIISTSIQTHVKMGKRGLAVLDSNDIGEFAIQGLRETIIESPVTSEDYATFDKSWTAVAKLMKAETDYPSCGILRRGKRMFENILSPSLERSNDPNWHSRAMDEIFDDLSDAHLTAVTKLEEETGFSSIDPETLQRTDNEQRSVVLKQAQYSMEAVRTLSTTLFMYRIENGEWYIADGSFRSGWVQLCIDIAAAGAEEYAVATCQTIIEMAVLENLHGPYDQASSRPVQIGSESGSLTWSNHLKTIRAKTDSEIVEEAFERMEYDHREGPAPRERIGTDESEKDEFYYSVLSVDTFGALNVNENFPDLLDQLRRQSSQGPIQ